MIFWMLGLFSFFLPQCLFAQSSDSVSFDGSNQLAAPSIMKGKADLTGSLRWESSKYPVSLPDNPKLDQSNLLTAHLDLKYKSENWQSKADVTSGKYTDWGSSFVAVQELYTSAQFNQEKIQLTFGRRLEFWSQVDSDWNLGLWEPQFKLDPLRPMNEGLTGLFYKQKFGQWEVLGFASPFFVPTMGPDIQQENGSLVSDSRWYRTPAPSSDILNKQTRIVYSLDVPDMKQLVNNPGAGVRVKWGGHEVGPWASMNFAQKPINSLLVRYDAKLALTSQASEGQVVVGPAVGYHNLWGADAGFRLSESMVSFSYLQDTPQTQWPQASDSQDWVQQQPGGLKIYGMHADTNLHLPFVMDPVGFSLDYVRVDEELTRDIDSSGQVRGSLFPYRTNFTNAVAAKTVFSSYLGGQRLLSYFKWLRDFDQRGTIVGVEFNYIPARHLTLILGADALGVDDPSPENTDARFINQFRANDRVYGGVSYVF